MENMTMTSTQTVKVTYRLSAAGQKAALLAGRPASELITDSLPLDPAVIDLINIAQDGSLSYNASASIYSARGYSAGHLALDESPASLAALVAAHQALVARVKAEDDAYRAKQQAEDEERKRKAAETLARESAIAEPILVSAEQTDPASPLPDGVRIEYGTIYDGMHPLSITDEQRQRAIAVTDRRETAAKAAKAAKQAARDAEIAATVEQYGGYMWDLESDMCDFLGYNLWSAGQTKRWVGVFDAPKGIARFCDSPRGEFVFDVSSLNPGDCIQGGGYDTNSRGKRRNKSEFFGVVLRNDDLLVVAICDSRSETIAKSRKMDR